jgi:hypothetical protein
LDHIIDGVERLASVYADPFARAGRAGDGDVDRPRGRPHQLVGGGRGAVAEHAAGGQHSDPQAAPVGQPRVADGVQLRRRNDAMLPPGQGRSEKCIHQMH